MEAHAEPASAQVCPDKTFSALTVDDVYRLAKGIGAEVERLIDGYGRESAEGLVPRIVKALELLEGFASRNQAHQLREEELLRTFQSIQLQQQKKRGAKDREEGADRSELRELQQKEQQWKRRCEELQIQVQHLQEDREELQSRLKGSHTKEGRTEKPLTERIQEIANVSKEAEALQEQLERFMKMNAELRHKQKVLEAQLKSTVERKADMEADLKEKSKEIEKLLAQLDNGGSNSPTSPSQTAKESAKKSATTQKDPDQPCFTKKEVRDILFERNELKTNLFLVQEELNYYQREILNEERCPGFLLEAVRSAIKKRRRLIKAKMLGIAVNDCSSSDEDDRASLSGRTEVDATEVDGPDQPAESRIRNLFGFLTRSGSFRSPTHMSSSASGWEIIGDAEHREEEEEQQPPP
ncbi:unnamed protein product [Menidia menidia]|uniref:(Atlantic silverside) hypothetical protein n=1 Tax=Menidia menidia TaxID=238744 RepID=A0A8S4BPP0_9TELE|nr:unnamed protein product [Menidia menidia]